MLGNRVIAFGVAFFLAGCGFTPQGDLIRGVIQTKGREAVMQGLENAEWFLCRAAPIGAIRDRYGRSGETVDAYNALCQGAEGILSTGNHEKEFPSGT